MGRGNEPKDLGVISTKALVLYIVACIVVYEASAIATFGVIGGAVSSVLSKALKVVVNAKRPHAEREPEPGMPSSHAQNLLFLSLFYAWQLKCNSYTTVCLVGAAIVLSALRVLHGHHTVAQVVVGGCVGATLACAWIYLVQSFPGVWSSIDAYVLDVFDLSTRRVLLASFALIGIRGFNIVNDVWKASFQRKKGGKST